MPFHVVVIQHGGVQAFFSRVSAEDYEVEAPGADSNPAQIYKEGGMALAYKLHQLLKLIILGSREGGSRLQGCLHHPSIQTKGNQRDL